MEDAPSDFQWMALLFGFGIPLLCALLGAAVGIGGGVIAVISLIANCYNNQKRREERQQEQERLERERERLRQERQTDRRLGLREAYYRKQVEAYTVLHWATRKAYGAFFQATSIGTELAAEGKMLIGKELDRLNRTASINALFVPDDIYMQIMAFVTTEHAAVQMVRLGTLGDKFREAVLSLDRALDSVTQAIEKELDIEGAVADWRKEIRSRIEAAEAEQAEDVEE